MKKHLLRMQMEVYLACDDRLGLSRRDYIYWLDAFLATTNKDDVLDITDEEVAMFLTTQEVRTEGERIKAGKAIRGLRRYYLARSKNYKLRLERGRPKLSTPQVLTYRKSRVSLITEFFHNQTRGNPLGIAKEKLTGVLRTYHSVGTKNV